MQRNALAFCRCAALVLTSISSPPELLAVEVWTIGGKERPWGQMGVLENVEIDPQTGSLRPKQISMDENLSRGAEARGGGIEAPQPTVRSQGDLAVLIDGDPNTAFVGGQIPLARGDIILDLGAVFAGVRRIRFYPRPGFEDQFLRSYELYISRGDAESSFAGGIDWQLVDERSNNTEHDVWVEFAPQEVQFVLLRFTTSLTWEIAELEVYGQGYVREGTCTSQIIDFGQVANFSDLKWFAQIDPGTSIRLVTQSGDSPELFKYYRTKVTGGRVEGQRILVGQHQQGGAQIVLEEVSKEEFEKLAEENRFKDLDTDHWSAWSAPYTLPLGEAIRSPSPRRYFRFQIRFQSTSFESGARVDSLSFDVSRPPIAHELAAEISPGKVRGGELTTFTYVVRPRMERGDRGFDGLEVMTPVRVAAIRGLSIDGVPVEDLSQEIEEDRFAVFFPGHRIVRNNTLLQLSFDTRVVTYGTRFLSRALDSAGRELAQEATPGDASPQFDTDDFFVAVNLEELVVDIMEVSPNPFTPNGDGLNEVTVITYRVLKLLDPVSVSTAIYDLSGRRVRELSAGMHSSGVFRVTWDGRDANGILVPPGTYLCRTHAPAQTNRDVDMHLVVVAY